MFIDIFRATSLVATVTKSTYNKTGVLAYMYAVLVRFVVGRKYCQITMKSDPLESMIGH